MTNKIEHKSNGTRSKTRIIATLGPASISKEMITKMLENGMACARLNTAHGDFIQYKEIIDTVRSCGDIPIMIDIKGPEIRIRTEKEISIKANEVVEFGFNEGALPHFSFDFSNELETGDVIYFDNGMIESTVVDVKKGKDAIASLKFLEECFIKKNKGVNVPGKKLKIPSLSEKDKECIKFAIEQGLSFIALSFARDKEDVEGLKDLLGDSKIAIISKIENHQGVENIDEIIHSSDGIMIARGDMGVELPAEKIPYIQKTIIKKCNSAGKVVIVATQMLESMTMSKVPTRAEVSDVANAVLDGADSVMLSGETASGKYPDVAVKTMRNISLEIEDKIMHNVNEKENKEISQKISSVAAHLAKAAHATKIICLTRFGFSARQIARYRPTAPLYAVTDNIDTYLQLKLSWGVKPVLIDKTPLKAIMPAIAKELLNRHLIELEDVVVFVGAIRTKQQNVSNVIEIHKIKEVLGYHEEMDGKE